MKSNSQEKLIVGRVCKHANSHFAVRITRQLAKNSDFENTFLISPRFCPVRRTVALRTENLKIQETKKATRINSESPDNRWTIIC